MARRSMTMIDPDLASLTRIHRGTGELASEYVADCGHAMPQPSAGDTVPDAVQSRVNSGDVWRSDRHWIVCGDSTNPRTVSTIAEYVGGYSRVTALMWDPLFDELMPPPPYRAIIPSTFVFTNNHYVGGEIAQWGAPAHVLTWDAGGVNVKHFDLSTRDEPLQSAKLCLWYGSQGSYDPNGDTWDRAVPHGEGRRGRAELTDVYRLSIGSLSEASHYQKPVDWVRRLIGCLSPDGVVLDPFCGTGTSLVAAQQLDRDSIGIEIVPEIADIALTRIEQWTGVPAVWEGTLQRGIRSVAEIEAESKRARRGGYARARMMQRFGGGGPDPRGDDDQW